MMMGQPPWRTSPMVTPGAIQRKLPVGRALPAAHGQTLAVHWAVRGHGGLRAGLRATEAPDLGRLVVGPRDGAPEMEVRRGGPDQEAFKAWTTVGQWGH